MSAEAGDILTIIYIAFSVLFGIVVGEYSAKSFSDKYLALKAGKLGRTAVCVRGKFYYIIPEQEYIELDLLRLQTDSQELKAGDAK